MIGVLHGNKNTLTGIIDVAMIGSMYSRGKFSERINSYGMVIMDECHHTASNTSMELLQKINAKYVYGVSATPKRGDSLDWIIYMLLGPLDYNGMFEYLYGMKYGEKFNSEDYPNGIPKEEFENLIMEYLPITAEQMREYAVFDEEKQTYYWMRLGCFDYAPTFFGTSLPEVVDIKENEDGTVTLTVEAVCDMVICDDAVITPELTVRLAEDGSFQYLGNEILNDGIMHIPDYQYRIKE